MSERNLSHKNRNTSLEAIREKIMKRKDLPYASVEQQLGILEEISKSKLGQFLIERGGLNGYWTQYVVSFPQAKKQIENPIEAFLLEKAPTSLATQQRFVIFKEEIQKRVKEGIKMASIPCGLMAEFLDLKFPSKGVQIVGIDIDEESLKQAKEYARSKKLESLCQFVVKDAWDLQLAEEFDLIASNGLSMYEEDDERVVHLFREFFRALKPGGVLITSCLTPPEAWDAAKVELQDALMQKLIFADILDCKWQIFRSKETTVEQLKRAGFSTVELRLDRASIFPTLIAQK